MTLPNWLQPADLAGSAARGAQLGMSVRAQDQAAEAQAARLALAQDEINIRQQQQAIQFQQSQQRAAEALRNHNSLEAMRQQNADRMNRIDQENRARESAKALFDRERFEWTKEQAKNKAQGQPEIVEVPDPVTGKSYRAFRTGPGTFSRLPDEKADATQKQLQSIPESKLKAEHGYYLKELYKAKAANATNDIPRITDALLKNETAQTNLIKSASAPKSDAMPDDAAIALGFGMQGMFGAGKGGEPEGSSLAPPGGKFGEGKQLDKALAKAFLRQANGDRALAEKMARDAGYEF
jgi:hypothetical protein